jgi:hypothetical protein
VAASAAGRPLAVARVAARPAWVWAMPGRCRRRHVKVAVTTARPMPAATTGARVPVQGLVFPALVLAPRQFRPSLVALRQAVPRLARLLRAARVRDPGPARVRCRQHLVPAPQPTVAARPVAPRRRLRLPRSLRRPQSRRLLWSRRRLRLPRWLPPTRPRARRPPLDLGRPPVRRSPAQPPRPMARLPRARLPRAARARLPPAARLLRLPPVPVPHVRRARVRVLPVPAVARGKAVARGRVLRAPPVVLVPGVRHPVQVACRVVAEREVRALALALATTPSALTRPAWALRGPTVPTVLTAPSGMTARGMTARGMTVRVATVRTASPATVATVVRARPARPVRPVPVGAVPVAVVLAASARQVLLVPRAMAARVRVARVLAR